MAFYVPTVGDQVPMRGNAVLRAFGRTLLRLGGWRFEGTIPNIPKMMIIVAPHTSNWDFPVGLMAKFALHLEANFIAKKSLFWWPLGAFLRSVGGIGIDRSAATDVVDGAVKAMRERPGMVLVITPEGTRSKVERWKSGFHRIALAAGIPIVLVVFDYSRKVIQLGPTFPATADYERDLAAIQSHITPQMACVPANY